MLAERFTDANPVANVFLMVAVLVVVAALVAFRGPIERFLERTRRSTRGPAVPAPRSPHPPDTGVLWVDDRPEHNARLLNGLRDRGVRLDVVRTVTEALSHLGQREYAIIVSDMSRVEDGTTTTGDGGLRLVEEASGPTPVVIFSRYAASTRTYRDHELDGGAVAVVSSEAEIRSWLRAVDVLT
jgi:CheY-like chemotaxis protein